jgi:hypothetical protein
VVLTRKKTMVLVAAICAAAGLGLLLFLMGDAVWGGILALVAMILALFRPKEKDPRIGEVIDDVEDATDALAKIEDDSHKIDLEADKKVNGMTPGEKAQEGDKLTNPPSGIHS